MSKIRSGRPEHSVSTTGFRTGGISFSFRCCVPDSLAGWIFALSQQTEQQNRTEQRPAWFAYSSWKLWCEQCGRVHSCVGRREHGTAGFLTSLPSWWFRLWADRHSQRGFSVPFANSSAGYRHSVRVETEHLCITICHTDCNGYGISLKHRTIKNTILLFKKLRSWENIQ